MRMAVLDFHFQKTRKDKRMFIATMRNIFSFLVDGVKKYVKNPLNIVYIVISVLIFSSFVFVIGKKEMDDYIEENLTERFEFDSDGCGNVYVRDGLLVSFETIYYENNFIALMVKMENNTGTEAEVVASIESLEESISFKSNGVHREYLIIGDSQYSIYDVNLSLKQGTRILAEGVVHVKHSAENGTTFLEKTTVYFKPEMEIYYLGSHDNTLFMIFDNKTPMDLSVSFTNDECGFSLSVPRETYKYTYVSGIGSSGMNVNAFDISIKEVSAEDIKIEEMDDSE